MASARSNLSDYNEANMPEASAFRFGIVVSEWNKDITHALYEGCFDTLVKHGVEPDNIRTVQVPGSFELPFGAKLLIANDKFDAVICLGCVIKGETSHNEYINQAVAGGLTNLSVLSSTPCIFGVLTPDTEEQALDRAGGKYGNKGVEAATTALRLAGLKSDFSGPKQKIGF